MKVVMRADEALSGRCTRGTTNWAAAIGKAVQDAVLAARAPAESALEDAARWQWLADYLIGERTDLDEGIVACTTVDALRQFADAARAPADGVTAPAGPSRFADVIAVQRSEAEADTSDAYMVGLYNGMSMMDANYRNITDWEPMPTAPRPCPAPPARAADSVLEDAARLDWLDQQCEAYGFQDIHEGNRWEISGPYANVRVAIDAERAARKQGGA